MLAARETIFARDIVGMVWHQSGSIAASKCISKVFMQLPIYPVTYKQDSKDSKDSKFNLHSIQNIQDYDRNI